MRHTKLWFITIAILVAMLLAGCKGASTSSAKVEPVAIEEIGSTGINRVILTDRAAERLAIQTATIQEEQIDGEQYLIIPYSALIYDLNGQTWVYVNPEGLTYYREPITVDHIDGDEVFAKEGPEAGTRVVTVGVAELYGADTGVGK